MIAHPNRIHVIIMLVVTTILFATTYTYIFDKKLDLNGDNANYYMLGKAVATGEGFVNINSISKSPNNHFPPGYPVLISGIITVFGDSITIIKLFNGLLFLATLILLYFLILKLTGRISTAVIVLLLLLLNSHLLRYSTMIMTEIPFLFFSIAGILAFLKIKMNESSWKNPWLYISLVLLIIAFYIKTSGVALIGGIVLYLIIIKEWKYALFFTISFILLAIPWQLRSQRLGGSSYARQLLMVNPYRPEMGAANIGDFVDRFGNNVGRYISKEIPSTVFPFLKPNYRESSSSLQIILGILLFSLIFYGLWKLEEYKWLIVAYMAGTFGILLLWPDVWVGVRFLLPAAPFLILGMVSGIQSLINRLAPGSLSKKLLWIPILLCLPFLPLLKPLHEKAKTKVTANWANYFALAKWANDNLSGEVVIACRKPTMFYLYSNTFTINYKYTEDEQDLISNLIDKRVDYVILDQLGFSSTYRYLLPAIKNNPEKFKLIEKRTNPDTYLLQLIK